MEHLQIVTGSDAIPKTYALTSDSIVIGRQPYCDLVLNNNAISREHAKLEKKNGVWYVEDLQSRNGVWLNGKRLSYEPTQLTDGDVLLLGDTTIFFHTRDSSPTGSPRAQEEDVDRFTIEDELDPSAIQSQFVVGVNGSSVNLDGSQREFNSIKDYQREIRHLEERVRVLLEFARILGKAEDVRDLKPRFLKSLLQLFPQADSACVLAPEQDAQGKTIWNVANFARRDERDDEKYRVSRAIIRHVVATRAAIISDSAPDDVRFDPSESLVISKISSVMAAPIIDAPNDRLIGVIQIDARRARRRFNQDDLRLLVSVANQIAVYWENQHLRDEALEKKLALREMQVANQVQRGFLPLEPPKIEGYEFFDYYRPAKFVGGDYFDYIPLPSGEIAIILGDVSGKGISASLLMAKLSSEMRYGLLLEKSYGATMQRLNRIFAENHWGDRFITLVMAVLEPALGIVRIYNAGHLYPVVSKLTGEAVRVGENYNSFPLVIVEDATFPEFMYHLEEGETIALMSDGFPDAMSVNDNAFGDERVADALRNPKGDDAKTVGKRLVDAMRAFADGAHQTDDQCLVVFRRSLASSDR